MFRSNEFFNGDYLNYRPASLLYIYMIRIVSSINKISLIYLVSAVLLMKKE